MWAGRTVAELWHAVESVEVCLGGGALAGGVVKGGVGFCISRMLSKNQDCLPASLAELPTLAKVKPQTTFYLGTPLLLF